MPDNDVVFRKLPGAWRRAYNVAKEVGTAGEVADELIYALARRLRETGGLPQLSRLASIVHSVAEERLSREDAIHALREFDRDSGNSVNARVAVSVARRMIGEPSTCPKGALSVEKTLAYGFCQGLAEHEFFSRVRPTLTQQRFGDPSVTMAWQTECEEHMAPRVAKAAEHLVRDVSATHLRASKRDRRARPSTTEILHDVNLLAGSHGTR